MVANLQNLQEPSLLKTTFEQNKKDLLVKTESYLEKNPFGAEPYHFDEESSRVLIGDQIKNGQFGIAIEMLEVSRENKTGIARVKITEDGKTSVIIRDARQAKEPPVRSTEAFEIQYLNAVRAGIEIAEIEGKPLLMQALQVEASRYIESFAKKNKNKSQDEIFRNNKQELGNLVILLEVNGVLDARDKLNVAKEFQNFKDEHANITTLTSIEHEGKKHTLIESEVGLRDLTEEQKQEYKKIEDKKTAPFWFTSMPKYEQELTRRHAAAITSGKHTISTQLRQLVGMKNSFEKITAIHDTASKPIVEVLHTSKHSGCLASFAHLSHSRQGISDMNTKQAQEWIGPDKKLHCNTFNSAVIGTKADTIIVEQTKQSVKNTGAKISNLPFNALRLSSKANIYDGAKTTLSDISESLSHDKRFENIKKYLDPKNALSVYSDFTKKNEAVKKEIDKLQKEGHLSPKVALILKDAVDVRRMISKADVTFRAALDVNNINADISYKLNRMANIRGNITSEEELKGIENRKKFPNEEILNMCASGKDRTGFGQHDQTAKVLAVRIGAQPKDLDKQILRGGHTANQAGSIATGGNSLGCHGTKKDNIQSLPVSRMIWLAGIIEVSADGNNIPKVDEAKIKEAKLRNLTTPQKPLQTSAQPKVRSRTTPTVLQKALPPATPNSKTRAQTSPPSVRSNKQLPEVPEAIKGLRADLKKNNHIGDSTNGLSSRILPAGPRGRKPTNIVH